MLRKQLLSSFKFDWQVCVCECVCGGGGGWGGGLEREREFGFVWLLLSSQEMVGGMWSLLSYGTGICHYAFM